MTAACRLRLVAMQPDTDARRQRRYRQRQRDKVAVYAVPAGPDVIEALLRRGMVEVDSRDRDKVAAELAIVLQQWARRWLEGDDAI